MKECGQLFAIDQEVTPINNTGRYRAEKMFGKTFHVHSYKFRRGVWYIMLKEKKTGPCACGCGDTADEYWDQHGFAPVISDNDLNRLLLEVELVNFEDEPIIIGPKKIWEGLGV